MVIAAIKIQNSPNLSEKIGKKEEKNLKDRN